ncbi:MAG: fumarate hydratase, partial [Bacteroidetes bacterium]|nr:fumarate hydratase [Bacteroidota bacterium]
MEKFKLSMFDLISETSANLPPDVRRAVAKAMNDETPNTQAALALSTIAINIDMAQTNIAPICQDTGMPTFYIHTPVG